MGRAHGGWLAAAQEATQLADEQACAELQVMFETDAADAGAVPAPSDPLSEDEGVGAAGAGDGGAGEEATPGPSQNKRPIVITMLELQSYWKSVRPRHQPRRPPRRAACEGASVLLWCVRH